MWGKYSQPQIKYQRSAHRLTVSRRSSLPGSKVRVVVLQYFLACKVQSCIILHHSNVLHARYLTIASHHPLRRELTLCRHPTPALPLKSLQTAKLAW